MGGGGGGRGGEGGEGGERGGEGEEAFTKLPENTTKFATLHTQLGRHTTQRPGCGSGCGSGSLEQLGQARPANTLSLSK